MIPPLRFLKIVNYLSERTRHENHLRSPNGHFDDHSKDNVPIEESDEGRPGVILDYDKEGDLVSLEVLDASERVSETQRIEFQTTA